MEKIKKCIESISSEQLMQMMDNINCYSSKTKNVLSIINTMLLNETLIFDGQNKLFYKRTGLMVWDKFR